MPDLPLRRVGLVLPEGRFQDPWDPARPPLPLSGDAEPGSWVEVEVTGDAVTLLERRAPAGSALAEVHALAARKGADPCLPPACEAEAAAWAEAPGIDDPALADLRHLPFCSIDEPTSRDLDQALFVEPEGPGHVVWYALADASHFVRPGSALMAEALRRGTTTYLPGLIAPMLPRRLCEDLVSLNPGVDRRAMVLEMHLDAHGRCQGTQVHRARVHSRAKLSYEGVQAWLDGGVCETRDGEVQASLRQLMEAGERRLREAESRDVVRFRREEVRVRVGGRGLAFVAHGELRNDVERCNEQVSLLANVEGAKLLRAAADRAEVQPIFRTHEPPRAEVLEAFARQLAAIVRAHELPEDVWLWHPEEGESLAAWVRRLPMEDGPLQGVARALQRQALRTGGAAGFGPEPGRHHGVGAEVYSRFTAPMREVVGIFVHKELWELTGAQPPRPHDEDEATRAQVIAISQQARSRQRALDHAVNRMVLDQLFRRDLEAAEPPARAATVMGVGRGKLHLRLEDPGIDVKVYARDLGPALGTELRLAPDAAQVEDPEGRVLFRVGDQGRWRVTGLDEQRDRWVLAPAG